MEFHVLHWPEGARFTRVRVEEGGIPRDAAVHLVPPTEPGAPAELLVCHRALEDAPPLTFNVEVSEDGENWVALPCPRSTQAA